MFKYVPITQQLLKERAKNAALEQENEKNAADIDYLAMMCDVELETEIDGEEVSENEEQEV